MNVLFITDYDISPLDGGIERITHNLAIKFRQKNVHSFLAFVSEINSPSSEEFAGKIQLIGNDWERNLQNLIKTNDIHCIITKTMKKENLKQIVPCVYSIAKELNCKMFFCYHNMPGYEMYGNRFIIRFLRTLGLSFIIKKTIAKKLKYGLFSDKIILESKNYIPIYQKIVGSAANEKFDYVNNALSFETIAGADILETKTKEVLIVTRFDESQKRVSLALKIWKKIEQSKLFEDWTLRIVGGGGMDEKFILNFAKKLQLKNVVFEGRQKPESYYKKASIFMMTSAYEGFPMTLGEAQQNGCVPIAFDSFASITDIINPNENGILVKNNDIQEYVNSLKKLMQNNDERQRLAKNGLKDCERYTSEKIVEKWIKLLTNEVD